MTETGGMLAAAGFDVRVPAVSRRGPHPAPAHGRSALRSSRGRRPAAVPGPLVGAVRRCRAERRRHRPAGRRRPAPGEGGRARGSPSTPPTWHAAAAALAERAGTVEMSGGAMLRHALGLEGSPWPVGVRVDGNGWAASCSAGPRARPGQPVPAPEGSAALCAATRPKRSAGWRFSTASGLGGCLALDMGLGKTPTVLAQLLAARGGGPALVIAPPAVVGNWAAEAARFTPDLRVVVHHGSDRASAGELAGMAAGADMVLTTYGTAVRDVEALAAVEWDRVVIDEAQAIKNPARRRPSSCAASRPAPVWPSPAPRSRTAWVTCGRSSTSPTRAWSGRGRVHQPALGQGRRRGARRRDGVAGPQRAAGLPPDQGRARHRGRAARAHRRARPLCA